MLTADMIINDFSSTQMHFYINNVSLSITRKKIFGCVTVFKPFLFCFGMHVLTTQSPWRWELTCVAFLARVAVVCALNLTN